MGTATALTELLRRGGSRALPLGALVTPRELLGAGGAPLSSGIPELDRLLGGGLPAGRLSELRGARGGGTALALQIVARLTSLGRLAAWVDEAHALDPRTAAGAGVDLRRLLWVRPEGARPAAKALDALLRGGGFALVLLDPRPTSALAPSTWVRLSHAARASGTALLCLGATGAGFCAALSLELRRLRVCYLGRGPGRTLEGFRARVELAHNRLGLAPGAAVELLWRVPELFPPAPG